MTKALLNVSPPRIHRANAGDCEMPSNGNALLPHTPLPKTFVADSPVSHWDVWRRQPGPHFCSKAVQTSQVSLLSRRSMTPSSIPIKITSSKCTQTESERHDAAVETSPDVIPLTLQHLKDELRAFAIAIGL